jgi:hypothetical protein
MRFPRLFLVLAAFVTASACAQAAHDDMAGMQMSKPADPTCAGPELACATAATPAFAPNGDLWVAWSANGVVSVARSRDRGATFATPIVLGRHEGMLDTGADARPQIAIDAKGRIVVSYAFFKDKRYNAQIMVATSSDATTFTPERSLSQDAVSQRFPMLAFEPDGTLFAAWLDKRTIAAARRSGVDQPGAALAVATSRDAGAHFDDERVVQDHTCECCHVGIAFDARSQPVVLYRAIFGKDVRDHAITTLVDGKPSAQHRVAVDDWHLDGCPHHGPGLAIDGDGTLHAAWFTQGRSRQGLFYARSTDGGLTFSKPLAIGDPTHQPGRPQLLARGRVVWFVWKEFDGKNIAIKFRRSDDGGATWEPDWLVGTTGASADHPMLVAEGDRVYISWMSREHGYRLIPLEAS